MKLFVFSGQISTILTPVAWFGLLASALWLVVKLLRLFWTVSPSLTKPT